MGNKLSVPQRVEEQENESDTDTHKVASEGKCEHNGGPVTMVSTHKVHYCYDEVDLGISVQQDTGVTSSPKTMELSAGADAKANGKNLGQEARAQPPAAKSRFSLTLSRPVPGRTRDEGSDPAPVPGMLDVSSPGALENKDQSERPGLSVAAAPRPNADKSPGHTPAGEEGCSATGELWGATHVKSKDSSFLDKLFKLDRRQEKVPVESLITESPAQADNTPESSRLYNHDSAEADIDVSEGKEREVGPLNCSLPQDPAVLDTTEEDPQAAETENNSIMSFFKTLVSPNKVETKKEPEDTGTEKSPATSADLKSGKVSFAPQETSQGTTKNPISTEPAKEGAKEKGAPTSLPLGKLFWKKSGREAPVPTGTEENVVCESPVEARTSEDVESALQTVDLSEEGEAAPGPAEVKIKQEDRKSSRTSLRAFFRQMSVKGDGGTSHSEDMNKKDASIQTSTEKPITPLGPEPAVANPKGKEDSSKDKKTPSAEVSKPKGNKQEARDPAPGAEPAVAAVNSLQNGEGLSSPRRPDKWKQPLGGFFKNLGPKRMLDAQVQTDPVSIGPVGKSK